MTDQERVIKDVIAFTERKEEERMLDGVKSYINKIKRQRDNLKIELKKYKSDEKIVELNKEIEDLKANSLFIFSEDEKKEEIQFKKEHQECDSSIYYFFKGTEIGVAVGMKCSQCGFNKDITDYSRW
ncbi:hypothetical protein P9173_09875 [Bacillus safensis]|uniref:hypothetical protein n=1 Tax=Bacillus safensis TaxID=561879 RepID=UPI002282EE86|nr:hypothetical protein [Bacillus safensis]MCY7542391.1 hypothetical protein [Bacillus safensis]MCY7552850.1 hypothetical protein [Bacillus safensis]MCY7644697.1 hypothetical protein [Bacillus safensis]MCY7655988.1 hypothetical protein [Bacillus safensis]MEC3710463.1 hypothetical protein [Bacillus safensis]